MRNLFVSLALISYFLLFSSIALAAADRAGDERAIKDHLNQFQSAWNKDDAQAMAALWAEDGSLINPVGVAGHGRAEIEKIFTDEHTHMFKGTKYETSAVNIQWITPDVAVVDVSANISGIHAPDGSAAPDYAHHVTWVLVKKDGQWLAAAARPYQFMAMVKAGEAK